MSDDHALKDVFVLDLSRVLAGPWAGQTLADLGARVLKVERPGKGDDTRSFGPPFFDTGDGDSLSAYFMSANRGKQSICIDMSKQEGVNLIKQLAGKADVLIENYKVGDLKKRGLDFETLAAINPRLIYCSITGFGQTGPYKQRPGYDFIIQGMAGLMSITGESASKSASGPQKVGVALADVLTGLYSTIAILAALQERQRSGLGQFIDMSLLDVVTACLANQASNYLVSGEIPVRIGNAHPNIVPYQTFATKQGFIIVTVGNDRQFEQFCRCLNRSDLARAEVYARNADRVENREKLIPEIQNEMYKKTMDEWLVIFEKAGVPAGPINDIKRVFDDVQTRARGIQISIDDMPLVANPIRYSRSAIKYDIPPPTLGQHTEIVLGELLGLDSKQIEHLKNKRVVS